MPHPIEENPLTKLPYALWATARPGSDTPASTASGSGGGVRLPRTIVFEYNFPKALYFTPRTHGAGAEEDEILTGASFKDAAAVTVQRIAGKDIDSRAVVELMCPPATAARKRRVAKRDLPASSSSSPTDDTALDFQAMYAALNINPASTSPDGGGGGAGGDGDDGGVSHHVATQYLSPLGLKYFMQGASVLSTPSGSGAGSHQHQQNQRSGTSLSDAVVRRITAEVKLIDAKDGILQRMPPSGCPHSEVIEAVWTRHMLVCEKLRNVHLVNDHALSNFDRAATFDGPPNMSTRKFVAPAIQDGIRGQIHDALRRVAAFVPGQRVVDATMYFRVDSAGELWLMFCTRLKLGALPAPESAPSVRADRIAKAIAQHTVADKGGFVQTGARPLSLVEFSEADVQRDFMLRRMTTAAEALGKASGDKQASRENGAGGGGGSRRSSSATLTRPGGSSATALGTKGATGAPKNAPVPFAVPAESKMVLLTGLTRRGTKYAKNTPWNQLAATNLAVESGIAQVRTRGEFDRIALDAPCFRPKPIEGRCLDRDANAPRQGTATRSALAKPMRWLKDPDIELTAHRYSSTLGSRSRQRTGRQTRTPPVTSAVGSPHDDTLRSNRGTPQKSSRRPEIQDGCSEPPSPKGERPVKRASIMLPDPLAGESGDDDAPFREPQVVDRPMPLAERIAAAESAGEQPETCLSAANASEWIRQLKVTATSHFRTTNRRQPLGFSLPSVLFQDVRVHDELLKFIRKCEFEPTDIATAIEADWEVHRGGVIDELSYHHQHEPSADNQEDVADPALGTVACFLVPSLRPVLLLTTGGEEFENVVLGGLLHPPRR